MTRVDRRGWAVGCWGLSLALGVALVAGPAGCRRARHCPQGHEEQRAGPTGVWCRPPGGKTALYLMLHGEKGPVRMHCNFAEGVLSGPFESFHPNGQTQVKGQYRAGKKEGLWVQTNASGGKVADGTYRAGTLIAGVPVGMASLCETVTP